MAVIRKAGSQWLYDSVTGDIVGFVDPDGGETMLVQAVTNPDGSTSLVVGSKTLQINEQDKSILVMGGDHPYDQWYGTANNGVAALYNSYGVIPYVAINTQGADTIVPGDATAMSWAELNSINGSGIEVVAHGARHVYDHRQMNTGVRIQYSGANASATVNVSSTTLTLTDSAPTAITITGKTLAEMKALVDAVSGWTCTIAPELLGTGSAENMLLLSAARTIKTGGVVTAANTYFACGGGIVIRYNGKGYAHVHALLSGTFIKVFADGQRIAIFDVTSATYDTLAELSAAIDAIAGLDSYVCNNQIAAVPAATNYILGDEKSSNLKEFAYANITETWYNVDAGMPQWYMEDRQLTKCKEDAASNGCTITHYAHSGAAFYPGTRNGHNQFMSYRGNTQTRYIGPAHEICALSPDNFFLCTSAPASGWTANYLNAVVDALADSGPFRINTLIHAVTADGSSGFPGIITHGSEDLEISEADLVSVLANVKAKTDAGQLTSATQAGTYLETRRRNKPANHIFNPKFRNTGASLLNVTEDASGAGLVIPGWQLSTPSAVFSAAEVTDNAFVATTTAATLTTFLSAEVQLEPGKTYEFGALLDVSAYTSGSGIALAIQYNRGQVPLIATPTVDATVTSGYYYEIGRAHV